VRTLKPESTEQSRAQSFPPCVICGKRHNWHECQAKRRAERGKRAPQRGGDPAKLADVLLASPNVSEDVKRDMAATLKALKAKRKAREEKTDG